MRSVKVTAPSSPRIAVLLDAIESDYHKEAIAGVCRAARTSGARVLVVAGGRIELAPVDSPARNFVYEFVSRGRIDGLVVLGAALASVCGIERFREWMRTFEGIPSVAVGLRLDDIPYVCADSEVGVRAVVQHLVQAHARRRIACVRGLAVNPEAGARYRAYQAALADHGLRHDERLVVEQTQLGWIDGISAVGTFFDKRRFTPRNLDAILCANDDVARGVLEALRSRSIAVPDQVAVVGFDNGPSAATANPPLTTVAQRVELQAYGAACNLIQALKESSSPSSAVLPTEPIFRASCGCLAPLENDSSNVRDVELGEEETCRLALLKHRSAITDALNRVAQDRLVNAPGWEQRVLDALLRDLTLGDTTHVVRELESVARRHAAGGGDVAACQDVLTTLRLQVLQHGGTESETRPILEDLFQEARLVLGRVGVDVERNRRDAFDRRLRSIAGQCHSLLARDSLSDLARHLDENLPDMGIKSFVISRFTIAGDASSPLEVISRRSHGEWNVPQGTVTVQDLGLDDELCRAATVVVEPLVLGSTPLGVAAFSWGAEIPEHYEVLRELISAALQAVQLRDR